VINTTILVVVQCTGSTKHQSDIVCVHAVNNPASCNRQENIGVWLQKKTWRLYMCHVVLPARNQMLISYALDLSWCLAARSLFPLLKWTLCFFWVYQIRTHQRMASHRIRVKNSSDYYTSRCASGCLSKPRLGYVIGLSLAKLDILKWSCSCKLLNPVTAHWQNNGPVFSGEVVMHGTL
jgi:hypothetical protein